MTYFPPFLRVIMLPVLVLLPLQVKTPNILFVMADDMGKRFDFSATEPAKTRELKQKLDTWLESVYAAIPQPNRQYDAHKQLISGTRNRDTWHKQPAFPKQ